MPNREATMVLAAGLTLAWSPASADALDRGTDASVVAADLAPEVGMIAYVGSSPDGAGWEIFTIRTDGSHRRQLTSTGGGSPQWSRDGSQLAFEGEGGIGVMAADGSGRRWVTEGSSPAWSPDDQRIAYVCPARGSVCVIDLQSQEQSVIVTPTSDWPGVGALDWSPDGSWITFTRDSAHGDDYTNDRQLFSVRPDGTDLHPILNTSPEGLTPAWSPDGSTLMYTERYDGRGGEYSGDLWSIRPDGTGQAHVTDMVGRENNATWSPDGQRIAFDSEAGLRYDKAGIWTMDLGTRERDLVVQDGGDPSWRPGFTAPPAADPPPPEASGRKLGFVAASEAGFDLFTAQPDGTDVRRLTTGGEIRELAWSPDHTQIAYLVGWGAVRVVDVSTGESRRVGQAREYAGLAWSPSGRRLAWGDWDGPTVLNLVTRERHRIELRRGCCSEDPAWSPNGHRLAFSHLLRWGGARDILTVSPSGGDLRHVTNLRGAEEQLDWAPNGRRILFTHRSGPDRRNVEVSSVRPNGAGVHTVVATEALDMSPAWSASGNRIALYSDGWDPFGASPRPGLWTVGRNGGHRELVIKDRTIAAVDW